MRLSLSSSVCWLATTVLMTAAGGSIQAADPNPESFEVSQPTRIPGATLNPGRYEIRVKDALMDRTILTVKNAGGSDVSTFLSVANRELKRDQGKALAEWKRGAVNPPAARGWTPSAGQPLEFVYSKDEAVALSKQVGRPILAIDPQSENLQPSALSKEDMQIVTLWMLTPTPMSPGSPEVNISAEKYKAQTAQAPPTATTTAAAKPQGNLAGPAEPTKLPKTAGNFAILSLSGIVMSLAGFWLLRTRSARS